MLVDLSQLLLRALDVVEGLLCILVDPADQCLMLRDNRAELFEQRRNVL